MKNHHFYFPLCLAMLLAACAKEDVVPTNKTTSSPPVRTELSFQVGERSYTASALMDQTESGQPGSCAGASGEHGSNNADLQTQWTRYLRASHSINITRQDLETAPAFRLNLWLPHYDLDAGGTPFTATDARLTLSDLQRVFVPLSDDPAANSGPLELEGSGEAISLTITSVKSDVVEGTFSGTVKAANGAAVKIEAGTFKARLWRL